MRNFSESNAANVNVEGMGGSDTQWLKAGDILYVGFAILSCNFAETKFGPKAFMHIILDGDDEATDYTVTFSQKAPAYAQLQALEEGDYPMRAMIEPQGQSYRLTDAPDGAAAVDPTTASATATPTQDTLPVSPAPVPSGTPSAGQGGAASVKRGGLPERFRPLQANGR